jgi:hypothetical protein
MRLHLGSPPVDEGFQPEADGWVPMREPTPLQLNLIAVPIAIVVGGALIAAWWCVPATSKSPAEHIGQDSPWLLAAAAVGLVGLVAVHELIHAFAYPKFGFTRDVVIGVWPAKLLCYAMTLGIASRTRLLVVYLMPFVILSLLPLLVCLTIRIGSGYLSLISVVNGMLASGDITIVGLIVWQVPANAVLKNKGWATWWKIPSAKGSVA